MTELPGDFPLPEYAFERHQLALGEHIGRGRATRHLRRNVVAIAALALVGALLITPTLGLGSRLLEFIRGTSSPPVMQAPVWSPDGQNIAVTSRRDGNWEVYVTSAGSGEPQNVTQHPARDSEPAWSPGGRLLAFWSMRNGTADIYLVNADGSGARSLTHGLANDVHPAWSPDGRRIAFVRKVPFRHARRAYLNFLYVVNVDGTGLRRLTRAAAPDRAPAWSPDGRTIRFGVYVANADGSGLRRVPYDVPASGVWSPDWQRVAFTVRHWRQPGPPGDYELFVKNADGSEVHKLTGGKQFNGNQIWAPDSRRIAFRSKRDLNSEIYVVNADGSGLRRLTRSRADERWFSWSPDGRKLSFVRGSEVYVMNADGSGQRALTQLQR